MTSLPKFAPMTALALAACTGLTWTIENPARALCYERAAGWQLSPAETHALCETLIPGEIIITAGP